MATALVAQSSIAQATTRVAQTRAGAASAYGYVDAINNSLGAQSGEQAVRYDERWQDLQGSQDRPTSRSAERITRFGGIFVTREVGTTIMQAQAQAAEPQTRYPAEVEKNVRVYEFNQALAGNPEAVTGIGLSRTQPYR